MLRFLERCGSTRVFSFFYSNTSKILHAWLRLTCLAVPLISRYYTVDVPMVRDAPTAPVIALAVPPMGGLPGQDESEMYVGTEGMQGLMA